MALFLLWAAVLQLNDPDPARWFSVYCAGAGLATLAGFGAAASAQRRGVAVCAALLTLVCLTWAAVLAGSLQGMAFPDLTAPMTPGHPEVEWAREGLGLLIVAGWSAGVAWRMRGSGGSRS